MSKSLIKQTWCEPDLKAFLDKGFSVVWEMFDSKGRIMYGRVVASDC
jgi:hypothetical protein